MSNPRSMDLDTLVAAALAIADMTQGYIANVVRELCRRLEAAEAERGYQSVNPDVPSPTPSDWDLMEAES